MVSIEHSEQVQLQSQHLSVVRTLQAVWVLLKHQRRYRRSLSKLSRFDARLLRDVGLVSPEISTGKIAEGLGSQPPILRQVMEFKPCLRILVHLED